MFNARFQDLSRTNERRAWSRQLLQEEEIRSIEWTTPYCTTWSNVCKVTLYLAYNGNCFAHFSAFLFLPTYFHLAKFLSQIHCVFSISMLNLYFFSNLIVARLNLLFYFGGFVNSSKKKKKNQ